jgi:hypothetical protein
MVLRQSAGFALCVEEGEKMATVNGEPKGLGGWLILPAIGLFIALLGMITYFNTVSVLISGEGVWSSLTTPGSEAYHPLWAPVIVSEMVANICLVLFDVALIFLFFMKSHRFPVLMVTFIAANLLYVVGDLIVVGFIPAVTTADHARAIGELARAIGGAIIWIPYFLVSKRVKNTFVKPEPNEALQPGTI